MAADPTLLRPTHEAASRAVLCGDPAVALALAQALLERPLMANHAYGLWGYVGTAADGALLSVQSTGIGGPCAALVVRDLAALGVRAAVRVGTAWGGAPGALLAATSVRGEDGASRALGGARAPDARLTAALAAGADATGALVSRDLPGGEGLHDLESAAVLAAADLRMACAVVVADGLDDEALAARLEHAGRVAWEALAA